MAGHHRICCPAQGSSTTTCVNPLLSRTQFNSGMGTLLRSVTLRMRYITLCMCFHAHSSSMASEDMPVSCIPHPSTGTVTSLFLRARMFHCWQLVSFSWPFIIACCPIRIRSSFFHDQPRALIRCSRSLTMVILPRHATYIYTRVLRCHVRQSRIYGQRGHACVMHSSSMIHSRRYCMDCHHRICSHGYPSFFHDHGREPAAAAAVLMV